MFLLSWATLRLVLPVSKIGQRSLMWNPGSWQRPDSTMIPLTITPTRWVQYIMHLFNKQQVSCFQCNKAAVNWKHHHHPAWIIHARWKAKQLDSVARESPDCSFVVKEKGKQFIVESKALLANPKVKSHFIKGQKPNLFSVWQQVQTTYKLQEVARGVEYQA